MTLLTEQYRKKDQHHKNINSPNTVTKKWNGNPYCLEQKEIGTKVENSLFKEKTILRI